MLRVGASLPLGCDDAVALAGARLQDGAIDDFDLATRALERACCFQGSECLGDAGAAHAQHHRKLVVRDRNDRAVEAITREQHNRWHDNVYVGPWTFVVHDASRTVDFKQWQDKPYRQDAGSTFRAGDGG